MFHNPLPPVEVPTYSVHVDKSAHTSFLNACLSLKICSPPQYNKIIPNAAPYPWQKVSGFDASCPLLLFSFFFLAPLGVWWYLVHPAINEVFLSHNGKALILPGQIPWSPSHQHKMTWWSHQVFLGCLRDTVSLGASGLSFGGHSFLPSLLSQHVCQSVFRVSHSFPKSKHTTSSYLSSKEPNIPYKFKRHLFAPQFSR